jgi:hypothetical protein
MIPRAVEVAGRSAALVAALGWGISVAGLLVPSATAFDLLQGLGADGLAYHPMLDYWLRMTAFAFTAIGVQFLAVALWWRRLAGLALAGAIFQLLGGTVLLVSALAIGLDAGNHRADIAFCWCTGALMLAAILAGRRLPPPARIRVRWVRRLALAWRRPGHPWEVGAITSGLLLWPYFTGARLIAPWVEHGRTREFRGEFVPVIILLLVVTLVVCFALRPGSSTPRRRILNGVAILSLVFGLGEYALFFPTIGMVRE